MTYICKRKLNEKQIVMILNNEKQAELQIILNEMFKGCNSIQVQECREKAFLILKNKFKMRDVLISKFIDTAISKM